MTTLEISLPDSLAKEAKATGLLALEAIERMVREAIRRRARTDAPEKRVRLVLDTNTVVAGLLWDNTPSRLIEAGL